MTQETDPVSRRKFLKAATLTAIAASATGAGAAIYNDSLPRAAGVTSVSNAPAPPLPAAVSVADGSTTADLFSRLAAAQAENIRLQAALDAAQGQLANLEQSNQTAVGSSEALAVELGQANEQIGVLAGLIALYEELDAVNLETAVEQGLAAVSDDISTMLAEIPPLSEGIRLGRQALQNFESQVPLLENGRAWLENHLGKIEGYFKAVEQLLAEAVDRMGPFLQMLNDWFESIKRWLPFGLGQTAATIMQSITVLIMETPNTINGLDTNITQPLNIWLSRNQDNETALHQDLIKPLRDDLLLRADKTVGKVQQIDTAYKTVLKEPVETAVANQRLVRNLIADYRAQHNV